MDITKYIYNEENKLIILFQYIILLRVIFYYPYKNTFLKIQDTEMSYSILILCLIIKIDKQCFLH